jgi:hypothetical protein
MSPARAKHQCTTSRRKYQQQVANPTLSIRGSP